MKKRAQIHYCKIHAKHRPLLIKNRAKLQPCKIHAKPLARSQNSTVFAQLLFQSPPAAVSLAAGRRTHFQKKREEGRSPPLSVRSEFCWDRILFNVAGADHVVGFSVVALGQLRIVHLEVDAEGPSKSQPLFRSDLIHPEIHYVRPLNLLNFEHVESFSFERGEVGEPEPFRLPVFSL